MARTVQDPVHGGEADRWGGWKWRKPSHGQHFRTCSYCGSIHPEDLADEAGWAAEWPALALDRIQAVSGLRFRFADGRVSWAPAR